MNMTSTGNLSSTVDLSALINVDLDNQVVNIASTDRSSSIIDLLALNNTDLDN